MGADGGTIPKRCELVKKKKKEEKLEKAVKNAVKWRTCQISQQPLKKPIIACRFGNLYNKEAIIEAILNKTISNCQQAAHIKGAKDFKELKLTENKDFNDDGAKGDSYIDYNTSPFQCPVAGVPMNGIQPFVLNWKCGCVVSQKAIDEVKSDCCHVCGGPFNAEDLVSLYPSEEVLQGYKDKLAFEKKAKKDKKAAKAETEEASNGVTVNGKEKEKEKAKKAEKRRAENGNIQDDPTKSDTYKKLFTTCDAAKNQPKAHWVTHNPLFY